VTLTFKFIRVIRKIENHDSNPPKSCIAVFARRCNSRDCLRYWQAYL